MEHVSTVTIYTWPYSQICIGCVHGEFIESNTFDSSCYRCMIDYLGNDGSCDKFSEDTNTGEDDT